MDLTFHPAGVEGFEDPDRSATLHPVGEVPVRVAALADLIRSKTAAGRPKDVEALPELRRLAGGQGGDIPAVLSEGPGVGQR